MKANWDAVTSISTALLAACTLLLAGGTVYLAYMAGVQSGDTKDAIKAAKLQADAATSQAKSSEAQAKSAEAQARAADEQAKAATRQSRLSESLAETARTQASTMAASNNIAISTLRANTRPWLSIQYNADTTDIPNLNLNIINLGKGPAINIRQKFLSQKTGEPLLGQDVSPPVVLTCGNACKAFFFLPGESLKPNPLPHADQLSNRNGMPLSARYGRRIRGIVEYDDTMGGKDHYTELCLDYNEDSHRFDRCMASRNPD